jgi:circadian clock protein KaiC
LPTPAAATTPSTTRPLSEPHSKLVRHLAPFIFFAPEKLGPEVEYIHLADLIRKDQPGQMEPPVSEVVRKTMEEQPVLVVIDSAKALRDFAGERELRLAFYDLTSRMAHTNAAVLLLGEYTPGEMASGVEFSLADSIIQLAYEPREPVDRRWVRVIKMRGTHHLEQGPEIGGKLEGVTGALGWSALRAANAIL